jgi:hypothetical protein
MAARAGSMPPIATMVMPAGPQPFTTPILLPIQSVSDPTVVTPMRLPLRSSTVLIAELALTMTAMLVGMPAIAATAFAGTPLAMNAMPGPLPMPISRPSAVNACWSLASPPKADASISSPCPAN